MKTIIRSILVLSALTLFLVTTAHADSVVVDPVGDFIPTYTGPRNGDLDVVRTSATLLGSNFIFSATMNDRVGLTAQGFYIWGVDRGNGANTANFAQLGLPNIMFDSVIRINPDGTGSVTLLSPTRVTTILPVGSITITGNSFEAVVPVSFLPSTGFAPGNYGQNLWPRWGGATGDAQISDFAPNDRNAGVNVVPEPTPLLLLGTGLAGIAAAKIRRRRKAEKREEA